MRRQMQVDEARRRARGMRDTGPERKRLSFGAGGWWRRCRAGVRARQYPYPRPFSAAWAFPRKSGLHMSPGTSARLCCRGSCQRGWMRRFCGAAFRDWSMIATAPRKRMTRWPVQSEIHTIHGNKDLSVQELKRRADEIYHPFHGALERLFAGRIVAPVLVTVHSFTPVYHGAPARDRDRYSA